VLTKMLVDIPRRKGSMQATHNAPKKHYITVMCNITGGENLTKNSVKTNIKGHFQEVKHLKRLKLKGSSLEIQNRSNRNRTKRWKEGETHLHSIAGQAIYEDINFLGKTIAKQNSNSRKTVEGEIKIFWL